MTAGSSRWFPRAARLGALALLSHTQGAAVLVLSPEIARDLGTSTTAVGATAALPTAAAVVAVLPLSTASWLAGRRGLVAVVCAVIGALATTATAAVTGLWGLALASATAGTARAAVQSLHPPLLVEGAPGAPVRALSVHAFGDRMGSVTTPLLAGAAVALLDVGWRAVLLACGLASLAVALCGRAPSDSAGPAPQDNALRFSEAARAVLLVPTARALVQACAVAGAVLVPFGAALTDHLETRFSLDALERGVVLAGLPLAGLLTLALLAPRLDRLFRSCPARVLHVAGGLFLVCVASLAVAGLVASLPAVVVAVAVAFAALAPVPPAVVLCLLHVVRREHRTAASAVVGLAVFVVGAPVGLLVLADAGGRGGTGAALTAAALPGLLVAVLARRAARTLPQDLRDDDESEPDAAGDGPPGLVCEDLGFGYDDAQVLRAVDLRVRPGEVVAVVGGNGAGKSTLLRVLTGLEAPLRGRVLLDGQDVTYLAAPRRVGLGVRLVPGGRAAFLPLTVEDNLRAAAHGRRLPRSDLDQRLDEVLDRVPALRARRGVRAADLSGGERHLLGLAAALVARPRLLLVDELSLGLSAEVLDDVCRLLRGLADDGVAVLLVEHQLARVLPVVDRVCLLHDGRVEELDARARVRGTGRAPSCA